MPIMISFSVIKKSKKSRARLGILTTPHGEIETPAFVGVATNATIKGLRSDEVVRTNTQILISNTYHLHIEPGESAVAKAGGINRFMQWPRPTMTDSGGFQVFSLGFGRDLGVGKTTKFFPGKLEKLVDRNAQPNHVKITDDGVFFRSPLSGKELFLGPRESIRIQEKIGADIIFAFDECTPSGATRPYIVTSSDRTHRWAKMCLQARKTDQALYGIVQGSHYKDLREESARIIGGMEFDGFGIGGDLGISKKGTADVLRWTLPFLDERKPRHLLGIGHLDDIEAIVREGVDTFDCTVPTHYARRGVAFTSSGRVDLTKASFVNDRRPLDPKCDCLVCANYGRNYIAHLIRAQEITGGALLTFHNLFFFNAFVAKVRERIKKGLL
jgi:queuine tRNA-ribosyltransferase/7-cyano-7-deazaguanine tRNA-ribosyltransferase